MSTLRREVSGATWITAGMAIGQLLVLGFTPMIANSYGPLALGAATTFLAIASVLSPVLTMRMEFLIPSADEATVAWINRQTNRLILLGTFVATLLFAYFFRPSEPLVALMFGVTCLALAGSAVSTQLLVRRHSYKRLGVAKAVNGLGQVGTQVPIGLLWPGFKGIELGYAVGYFGTLIAQRSVKRVSGTRENLSRSKKKSLFRSSMQLCIGGVMNALSVWAILLSISAFHSPEDAGVFAAIQRLLVAPAGFVTAGLLPVVTGSVAAAIRNQSSVREAMNRWLKILTPVSVGVILSIFLLPEEWLLAVLGPEYEGVGGYLDALALMVGTQIVAGPLGQALVAMGANLSQFLWDASRFVLVFIAAIASGLLGAGPIEMTWLLSSIFALSYLVFILLVYRMSFRNHSFIAPSSDD